jgi:uncharacterized 2Fe-2S/4Fe-4S cluster protein (DUF4445 family)
LKEVLFFPLNKRVKTDGRETVLQIALREGIYIKSVCGGKGKCGKCRVIVRGKGELLPPPSINERELLGDTLIKKGYRLACEILASDIEIIQIPEESQRRRDVILTSDTEYLYPSHLHPVVKSYFIEVPKPCIDSLQADRERLLSSLKERYGLKGLVLNPRVLRRLPNILRGDNKEITVILWNDHEVIDLREGMDGELFGMAFDIGTTTVVGYLFDMDKGKMLSVKSDINPQVSWGCDVISRISFCQEKLDGLERLRNSIVGCINNLISEACSDSSVNPDRIVDITVAGNTVMHHLLLGLNPAYLAIAPYPPVMTDAQDFRAIDLGIDICESAYIHLLPLKAGFVGSDTICCILATGIHRRLRPSLLIDLGTNGEIVIGSKEGIACCSTAAGPAFEGGHIKWGMRASSGAIERIRIEPESLNVRWKTIHNNPPVGICGSGVISAVSEMIRSGIVMGKGNFDTEIKSDRLREGEDGWEFVLVWANESGIGQDIVITQKDVSELLLAKAAIYAGVTILMEEMGIKGLERIFLAGAFGNYVDPVDVATIDLFPHYNRAKIIQVGNAAGYGACMALLDRFKRKEAQRIARMMEYVELSAKVQFQDLFVSSMFFTSAKDYGDEF